MCEACDLPGLPARAPEPKSQPQRLKLWEIDSRHHCTIVGTCLSMRELWKLARKARLHLPDNLSDYDLHGAIVSSASRREPLGHLIHRLLDRKYRTALDACKKLDDVEALTAFWLASLEAGDIPGPLWAVMSHGLTSHFLRERVFGDVHMLSHLVGASNRADIKRLGELERALEAMADAREAEKASARQTLEQREREIETLKMQLSAQTGQVRRAAMLESRLERFESGETVRELSARNRTLGNNLKVLRAELQDTQAQLIAHRRDSAAAASEVARLSGEVEILYAERDSLERVLEQELANLCHHCEKSDAGQAGSAINLGGACVVYVGGRTSHISHIRQLVEQANGRFHHHDGGLEDGDGRLEYVLGRGDVVMCPVDCVSHSACLKAKKFCKHAGKAFVPLRSSGLSSFAAGLRELADPPPGPDALS